MVLKSFCSLGSKYDTLSLNFIQCHVRYVWCFFEPHSAPQDPDSVVKQEGGMAYRLLSPLSNGACERVSVVASSLLPKIVTCVSAASCFSQISRPRSLAHPQMNAQGVHLKTAAKLQIFKLTLFKHAWFKVGSFSQGKVNLFPG